MKYKNKMLTDTINNWEIITKGHKKYWHNTKTNELIWIHPKDWKSRPENLMDWRPIWSKSKKKWYWWNHETDELSWIHPNLLKYIKKNKKLSNKYKKKGKKHSRKEGKMYAEHLTKKKRKYGKSPSRKLKESIARPIEIMDLIREGSNEISSNSSKGSKGSKGSRDSKKRKRTKKKK